MKRPLRSVLIGDVDFYPSEFIFGVAQGMSMLGHWHTTVNVRHDISVIKQRVEAVQPDVIWGHMLLWAPGGSSKTEDLLDVCAKQRDRGAKVVIHDGDARDSTRFPHDVSACVDLALCNHLADRSAWKVRQERWPYFAFCQEQIADPVDEFRCALAFAGRLGAGIYAERSTLVGWLQRLFGSGMKIYPTADTPHTLFRTPELAASADAVLGYGRPESKGWTDVRVFQYPGAGGVLWHDDADEFLRAGEHYVKIPRAPTVDDINRAVEMTIQHGNRIRHTAFAFMQENHSSLVRVQEALDWLGF